MAHRQRHGGGGEHAHAEGAVDPSIATSERGIWAVKWSFVGLFATALVQAVVVALSGSVALLSDTIHNFGDAATAIPLWIAFALARLGASRGVGPQDPKDVTRDVARDLSGMAGELAALKADAYHWLTGLEYAPLRHRLEDAHAAVEAALVVDPEGVITAFGLAPAASDERPIGEAIVASDRYGAFLADKGFTRG